MLVRMIATNTYSRPLSTPRMAMILGWLVLGLGWVTVFAIGSSLRRCVAQVFASHHRLGTRVEPQLFSRS